MNLPNTQSTKQPSVDPRACLQEVEKRYGVKLLAIADDQTLSPEERRQKMRQTLFPAIQKDLASPAPSADPAAHEAVKRFIGTASESTSDVSILPNVWFEQSFITSTVAEKTGSDVSEWVSAIMNGLKLTQNMTTPAEIATQIVLSGIFGLGPVVYYAATAEGTLTLSARILAGVTKLGVAGWAALAAVIILDIATWLMGQDDTFCGAIANNTTQDFKVRDWRDGLDGDDKGDLYLHHGKMIDFMVADVHHMNDDQEVQLGAVRQIQASDQTQTMVSVGLFTGSKRSGALVGVEGAIVFTPKSSDNDPYLVLAFTCPYNGNNGAAVNLTTTSHSAKKWWESMESSLGMSSQDEKGSFNVSCQVSNQRGSQVSAIVVLNQTT